MYQVTCPSCHAVVSTPFVRIGAVLSCRSCKQRCLIDAAHVKHVPSQAQQPARGTEAGPEASAPMPGGMHGLSDLMRREAQRERDSKFDDYDTIAPEPDAPASPAIIPSEVTPVPTSQMLPASGTTRQTEEPEPGPAPTKQQKAVRMGYIMAVAAALVLACFGVGIWFYLQQKPQVVLPVQPVNPPDPLPVYEGPIFQGLPLLESHVLEHSPWAQPNQPFVSVAQQDEDVYLTVQKLEPGASGAIDLVCRVVSERPGVILDGEVTISLVNPQGIEKARTTTPFALVSPEHPMMLRIPIPANLDPTALTPTWSIQVKQWIETAEFMDNCSIKTHSAGADTMGEIVVVNDWDRQAQGIMVLVTAVSEDGVALRRWYVQWDLPLHIDDYIEVITRTAVNPLWDIREWNITAVAVE